MLTSAGVASGLDLCLHILRLDHGADARGARSRGGSSSRPTARAARRSTSSSRVPKHPAARSPRPAPGRSSACASRSPCATWRPTPTCPSAHSPAASTPRPACRSCAGCSRGAVRRRARRARVHVRVHRRHRRPCGFGTAANLRKHFRRGVSTTPTAYRPAARSRRVRSSGRTNQRTTSSSAMRAGRDPDDPGVVEEVGDHGDRQHDRDREEHEAGDQVPVGRLDDERAVVLVEAQAVGRRRARSGRSSTPRWPAAPRRRASSGSRVMRSKPCANGTVSRKAKRNCTPGSATRSSLRSSIICRSRFSSSSMLTPAQPHVVAGDEREQRGVDAVQRAAVGAEQGPRVLRTHIALDQ